MRIAFLGLLILHAPSHFMNLATSAGLADLCALTLLISLPAGAFVLLAGASVLLLLATVYAYLTKGPRSFRAEFERDARIGVARVAAGRAVTDADLERLPPPVRRYLQATGFAGEPRVQGYRLGFRGRIRSAADAAWMPFEAEQRSFVDPPMRLFHMRARMFGLPVEAYHRLEGGHATMRVRLLGAIPIVDARGDVMDRSEAVTLFNDMAILAPGSLVEPSIEWEPVDERSARARFTNGAQTISATLFFDEAGLLSDFVSDDRSQSSADGKTFTRLRFSTPVRDYRVFGRHRIAAHGEARWHAPTGVFTYGEFELVEIAYRPEILRTGDRD